SELMFLNELPESPHLVKRKAKLDLCEVKVGAANLFFGKLRERCNQVIIEPICKKVEKRQLWVLQVNFWVIASDRAPLRHDVSQKNPCRNLFPNFSPKIAN